MSDHTIMIKAIEEAVDKAVEKSINGKLRALDQKLGDYIKGDMEWKEENQPALDKIRDLTSGWKVILGTFTAMAVIAGGIIAVKKLFNI